MELPAPTLSGSGWNTGSYDWAAISRSADYIKLQPDLDQSLYRKQMPDLMKYLTTEVGIDPKKLVLVTSPYSIEKSDKNTRAITRLDALSIASQIRIEDPSQATAGANVKLIAPNLDHSTGGSGLIWDNATASVEFAFKVGESIHVVWIQNLFSEGFKLEYAQLYHLGGIASTTPQTIPPMQTSGRRCHSSWRPARLNCNSPIRSYWFPVGWPTANRYSPTAKRYSAGRRHPTRASYGLTGCRRWRYQGHWQRAGNASGRNRTD